MRNRQTITLSLLTAFIIVVASIVGILFSPKSAEKPPTSSPSKATAVKLSDAELQTKLTVELPLITNVLTTAYPLIPNTYTVDQGKLYEQGQWYTTTLTSKDMPNGSAFEDDRDTLRVLMQKKDGTWVIRTNPPQILLNSRDLPDVPKYILDTVNKPSRLPGTKLSPEIIPGE